jgi:hypothetical protein
MVNGPPDAAVAALVGYEAHSVPAHRAGKRYVCPTCDATIGPGVGHVVAWPEGQLDARRHWHRHCWRLVARRGRIG